MSIYTLQRIYRNSCLYSAKRKQVVSIKPNVLNDFEENPFLKTRPVRFIQNPWSLKIRLY